MKKLILVLAFFLGFSSPVFSRITTVFQVPAGSDKGVQYNDNFIFGSSTTFTYDKATGLLTVTSMTVTYIDLSATSLDMTKLETDTGFNIIVSTEIDTYSELDAIVGDVTLTHNGLIDTYSELNTIVADVTLTHNGLIDTYSELDAIVADQTLTHNGLINTYSEINAIVADVTLTHNGLIDTFSELDTIVADETLVNTNDAQTLTTKTIDADNNTITNIGTSEMADADHGDVSWSGGVATVDNVAAANVAAGTMGGSVVASSVAVNTVGNIQMQDNAITNLEMADSDHGDVSWTSNVATVDNVAAANVAAGALGASVLSSSVAVDSVYPSAFNATNTPSDGQVYTYDTGSGGGTWEAVTASGGGGIPTQVISDTNVVINSDNDSDGWGLISLRVDGTTVAYISATDLVVETSSTFNQAIYLPEQSTGLTDTDDPVYSFTDYKDAGLGVSGAGVPFINSGSAGSVVIEADNYTLFSGPLYYSDAGLSGVGNSIFSDDYIFATLAGTTGIRMPQAEQFILGVSEVDRFFVGKGSTTIFGDFYVRQSTTSTTDLLKFTETDGFILTNATVTAYAVQITSGITINGVEYFMPSADGTADQVLHTDGARNLSWADDDDTGGGGGGGGIPTHVESSTNSFINADSGGAGWGVVSFRINGATSAYVSNDGNVYVTTNTLNIIHNSDMASTIEFHQGTEDNNTAKIRRNTDNSIDIVSAGGSTGHIGFATNGSARQHVIFEPNGNPDRIGFNETTPDAVLEVSADNQTSNPMFYLSSDDGNDGDILTIGTTQYVTFFSTALTINGYNVGIGSASATHPLVVMAPANVTNESEGLIVKRNAVSNQGDLVTLIDNGTNQVIRMQDDGDIIMQGTLNTDNIDSSASLTLMGSNGTVTIDANRPAAAAANSLIELTNAGGSTTSVRVDGNLRVETGVFEMLQTTATIWQAHFTSATVLNGTTNYWPGAACSDNQVWTHDGAGNVNCANQSGGTADETADYRWTGSHTFISSVTVTEDLEAFHGRFTTITVTAQTGDTSSAVRVEDPNLSAVWTELVHHTTGHATAALAGESGLATSTNSITFWTDTDDPGAVVYGDGIVWSDPFLLIGAHWVSIATMTVTITTNVYHGRFEFAPDVDQADNFGCWKIVVPWNVDTSTDPIVSYYFNLGGADTATHRYVISGSTLSTSEALSNARRTEFSTNLDFAGDGSGIADDEQIISNIPLSGWNAGLTAGAPMVVCVARDGDTSDASTVLSTHGMAYLRFPIRGRGE